MVEDGHGWKGAIALKFVQTVFQPAPILVSSVDQRQQLLVHPLDLPDDVKLAVTERKILGCPSTVALNSGDWRKLRTSQWSLQALFNIRAVVCGHDSVLVVMGGESGIYVDVIGLDGRIVLQARARVSRPVDLYAVEEAQASKTGWRIRLVGYRPGSSIDVPRIPLERFEIAIEPSKPS